MAKGKKRIPSAGTRLRPAPLPRAPRGHSIALAVLSAAGVAISAYLTYAHHRLTTGPGWKSFCAITTNLDCDTVITSPFGTVGGVPLSAIALWFYLLAGALAAACLTRRRWAFPQSPTVLLLVAGVVATLVSVYLAAVSAFLIGAWCLLCTTLYALNAGILAVAWQSLRRHSDEGVFERLRDEWRYGIRHRKEAARAAVMALGGLAAIAYASSRDWSRSSPFCRAVASIAPDVPITIVVYSDFQCPACRKLNSVLRTVRSHPRLRIVDRHYPLDRACNPGLKRGPHPGACLQARAAICAGEQARYDDFSDRVFDHGPVHSADLVDLATSLGLDRSRFEACLQSERASDQLAASIREALAAGASGTPTILINGQRHSGALGAEEIECLERAAGETPAPQSNSWRAKPPRQPWYAACEPSSGTLTTRRHREVFELVQARSPPRASDPPIDITPILQLRRYTWTTS